MAFNFAWWAQLWLAMKADGLDRPNPDQSWSDFMRAAYLDRELYGMVLVWRQADSTGRACAFYLIATPLAIPQPADETYPVGYYKITGPDGNLESVQDIAPAQHMIRVN